MNNTFKRPTWEQCLSVIRPYTFEQAVAYISLTYGVVRATEDVVYFEGGHAIQRSGWPVPEQTVTKHPL